MDPGARRKGFQRVLENHLINEVSWIPCPIDFGIILGGPWPLKIIFSYHSGTDFSIFRLCSRSHVLGCQKPRFEVILGVQVGQRKRINRLQETSWPGKLSFVVHPETCPEINLPKSTSQTPQNPRDGNGGRSSARVPRSLEYVYM